jgi:HlyD family secretion protein
MRKFLFFILLLLVIAAAGFYFYLQEQASHRNALILFGNVDVRQVDLGFRVLGRVKDMHFEEGDWVDSGKLMATLDKQPYSDQVKEAFANQESITASLKNAEKILKRRQELISDGSISQEDLDNAEANVKTLSANLNAAKVGVEVALSNLRFTEVFSPNQGTILTRIREPGTVVTPGDPVYTLSILSPVWIRAFITEPDLGLIYPGMKAKIHTDVAGGRVYEGQVGFISPVAEFTPKTVETMQLRTDLVYRLRIYADNPDKFLKQGMPVTVMLSLHKESP